MAVMSTEPEGLRAQRGFSSCSGYSASVLLDLKDRTTSMLTAFAHKHWELQGESLLSAWQPFLHPPQILRLLKSLLILVSRCFCFFDCNFLFIPLGCLKAGTGINNCPVFPNLVSAVSHKPMTPTCFQSSHCLPRQYSPTVDFLGCLVQHGSHDFVLFDLYFILSFALKKKRL